MGTQLSSPSQQRRQSRQISAQVYWGQTALWIKMALGMEVGLGPGHIVLDGDSAPPPPKGAQSPNFRPISIVAKRLDVSGYLCLGDIVLDGVPAPPPLKGHSPQFSVHVRCGQTARWTKMPLGMEVGLGPGVFVLDGDPAPPRKGHSSPPLSFRPMSIVATVAHRSYR